MSYPHYSSDCVDYHGRVIDWRGTVRPVEIITLCGSTKFKEQFEQEMRRLTLEGNIVISVGLFGHIEGLDMGTDDAPSETKIMLDELHKRKIDMADRVHVINVGGYVGASTRSEIAYAEKWKVPITYLEEHALV
jgi:hypothetical protein